jgi:hypothetical protein
MPAPEEIAAEQVMEAIRHRLQANRTTCNYPPGRVVRTDEFKDTTLQDMAYRTVWFIVPFPARETERANRGVDFEVMFSLLGCRKFLGGVDPFTPPELIVAEAPWANGPLTIAQQPTEPGQLFAAVRDDAGTVTAGLLTVVGLDKVGAALTATYDLAVWGKEATLLGCFSSVSSATLSGVSGAGGLVRILGGATRWQVKNRLWKDAAEVIIGDATLRAVPSVSGMVNVFIDDVDFDLKLAGWALLKIDLRAQVSRRAGSL